jgi:hypothetical protein
VTVTVSASLTIAVAMLVAVADTGCCFVLSGTPIRPVIAPRLRSDDGRVGGGTVLTGGSVQRSTSTIVTVIVAVVVTSIIRHRPMTASRCRRHHPETLDVRLRFDVSHTAEHIAKRA